jgi:hypothetical protein
MGNLILFLVGLPFVVAGGFSILSSSRELRSADPSFLAVLIPWIVGVMFILVGAVLIIVGVFGREVKPGETSPLLQKKKLLGILSAEEQWSTGRVNSRAKKTLISVWLVTVVVFVWFAPVIWVAVTRGAAAGDNNYRWWLATVAIPAFFLARAAYQTLRWQKFGRSICEILTRPRTNNGVFRCMITPQRFVLPAGDATVSLRCEKREWINNGRHRRLIKTNLWQHKLTVPVQDGLGIDATFNIPPELPETAHRYGAGIFWILEADLATVGVDFHDAFYLALKRDIR